MRDFVDTLPLRLAAVVAALVGAICLWNGVEIWESARRIGIAFVVVLLASLIVRRLLLSLSSDTSRNGRPPTKGTEEALSNAPSERVSGRNVDVITPGASVGELLKEDRAEDE